MKIKSLSVIVGVSGFLLVGLAKLKPDVFYSADFSFIEYFMSVMGTPILLLGLAIFAIFASLFTKYGDIAANEIKSWVQCSPLELRIRIQTAGFIPIALSLMALVWTSYEAYAFTRNLYSFLRDRFIQQYQIDAFSRCRTDHIQGHLTLAKTCFANFSKKFEGHQLSAAAERDIKKIDKQIELKQALVAKARISERVFGPTPLSIHLKTEGLWLHPWDSELRNEISNELRTHFEKALFNLKKIHQNCSQSSSVSLLQATPEAWGLLGYMKKTEIGPTPASETLLSQRLCAAVSPLSFEQLQQQVNSIWQRSKVEGILANTDQEKLERQRQIALQKLRYSTLKEEVRTGHRERPLIVGYPSWVDQDQRFLNPAPPAEMIPTSKKNQADTKRGILPLKDRDTNSLPTVPSITSVPELVPMPQSRR